MTPETTCRHEVFHLEPTNPDIDESVLNIPIRCADCTLEGLVVLGEKVWDGVIYFE